MLQVLVSLSESAYKEMCENGIDNVDYDIKQMIKNGIIINRNLCDSCINNGCIFQSGIVRSHCDFYKAGSDDIMGFVKKIVEESGMVKVVKCKDCIHNGSYDTDCPITWSGKEYCSFGERGDENDKIRNN